MRSSRGCRSKGEDARDRRRRNEAKATSTHAALARCHVTHLAHERARAETWAETPGGAESAVAPGAGPEGGAGRPAVTSAHDWVFMNERNPVRE